jgi:nitrite reductase (NADH) small subunit
MPRFVTVATTDELAPGGTKQVQVDEKTLALFNLAGTYYAIDDTCPHRGGPLSEGAIEGEQVPAPGTGQSSRSRPARCSALPHGPARPATLSECKART